MNNIGQRIKDLRKKNGLTQEKLADYLGVTYKSVSKWECGVTLPDLAMIVPLTKVLHVSADELLNGKDTETDARRAEMDKRCEDFANFDLEEMYQLAQEAVSEYPGNDKYLIWLAELEYAMAYTEKSREANEGKCSSEKLERAIRLYSIVIEDSTDSELRRKAIWNTMICYMGLDRCEEALKYAEMLPNGTPYTRDSAMVTCLRGFEDKKLGLFQQKMVHDALVRLCWSLTEVYGFTMPDEPHVRAAIELEEAVLKTFFPNGEYNYFYRYMLFLKEKQAELELKEGNHDKAMEYLKQMVELAKNCAKLEGSVRQYSCDIFGRISIPINHYCFDKPIQVMGDENKEKQLTERVRNELTKEEKYAPLRDREDFKALLNSMD